MDSLSLHAPAAKHEIRILLFLSLSLLSLQGSVYLFGLTTGFTIWVTCVLAYLIKRRIFGGSVERPVKDYKSRAFIDLLIFLACIIGIFYLIQIACLALALVIIPSTNQSKVVPWYDYKKLTKLGVLGGSIGEHLNKIGEFWRIGTQAQCKIEKYGKPICAYIIIFVQTYAIMLVAFVLWIYHSLCALGV